MAEAACANPVRIEVIVDPVFVDWANAARDIVQAKRCPRPPGDVVVSAGAIAADAKGADNASFKQWLAPRAPATRLRATETARRMLEAYEAPPLDPTIDEVLLDFIARGKAELPDGVS